MFSLLLVSLVKDLLYAYPHHMRYTMFNLCTLVKSIIIHFRQNTLILSPYVKQAPLQSVALLNKL